MKSATVMLVLSIISMCLFILLDTLPSNSLLWIIGEDKLENLIYFKLVELMSFFGFLIMSQIFWLGEKMNKILGKLK